MRIRRAPGQRAHPDAIAHEFVHHEPADPPRGADHQHGRWVHTVAYQDTQ